MVLMRSVVKYVVGVVLAILLAGGAFHAGMFYESVECFNYIEYRAQVEPLVLGYDTRFGYDYLMCSEYTPMPPIPTVGPPAGTRG